MKPSIRQLECAAAVAEHRHFGRAARACAITQPALSAQIRALEETLGVRLFERSRRGVLTTTEGEAVLERARAALRAVDDVVETAADLREPLSGALRLGVIPTVAPYLLPQWLKRVRAAHPGARLLLHEDQTARLVAQLRGGALDLLLLALPLEEDGFECLPLFEEPFWLAAPEGHSLARGGRRRVAERELDEARVLLLEDGHCLRDQALAVCRAAGASESEEVRATSLPTLVQMVASGLGVTLLPARAARVEVGPDDGIVLRRFQDPEPSRSIGFAWRKASPRGDTFQRLAALLRDSL